MFNAEYLLAKGFSTQLDLGLRGGCPQLDWEWALDNFFSFKSDAFCNRLKLSVFRFWDKHITLKKIPTISLFKKPNSDSKPMWWNWKYLGKFAILSPNLASWLPAKFLVQDVAQGRTIWIKETWSHLIQHETISLWQSGEDSGPQPFSSPPPGPF